MVPRVCESKEGGCRCLLNESSAGTAILQRPRPPFLIRILRSFGFIKTILKSVSSESSIGTNDDFRDCGFENSTISDGFSEPISKQPQNKPTVEESCSLDNQNEGKESEVDYGTFLEFADLEPADNLALQVKEIVTNSPDCACLRISDSIAFRIARDIIESAENEPCGLQGCRVVLHLDERLGRIQLGEFSPKNGFICTFELHVMLRIRSRGIRYFLPFLACMPQKKLVSDRYSITKEKLYTCSNSRSGTPVNWQ